MPDALVVGGGHNGLVCACYLARAGLEVLVLEQAASPGGGSRSAETIPGYRFDLHSAAHNIINMTDIPAELDLAGAGLRYVEMDPFATAVFTDGRIVRFHRDVERTVASLREVSPAEADAYADFMDHALPVIDTIVAGVEGGASRTRALKQLPGRARALVTALHRHGGPAGLARELLSPCARVLTERLESDLTRAPVAAFAAHAGASPAQPGSAVFGLWQAVYHRFGQWHAVGGAQALTDALVRRLEDWGGTVRCGAPVERIVRDERVRGVVLAHGERVAAPVVVTAIDPKTALLDLLDPPLDGPQARALAATHRSNTVQMLVHVATDRLPPYRGAVPSDYAGLQSYVDSLGSLVTGFAAAEARSLPADPVPTYSFTPSALDASLAPRGHHTVYLACPCAPYRVDGGWEAAKQQFAERMLDTVEARAAGFRDSVQGIAIRTPEDMAAELCWPGANPMVLDVSLDQLAFLRPTRLLATHRTPVRGLFVSGAGTAPVGGIAGSPGRAAAKAVLGTHGAGPSRA